MFLSNEEILKISSSLEEHHSIFYFLWKVSRFIFTDNYNGRPVRTAGVTISNNEILFFINENYWKSLNFNKKLFLFCHEILHIVLKHPQRAKNIKNSDFMLANYCADAVVNQMLVTSFGFSRKDVDNLAIFPDNLIPGQKLPINKSFEFYFQKSKYYGFNPECKLIDEHHFADIDFKKFEKILEILPDESKKISLLSQSDWFTASKKKMKWPLRFQNFIKAKNESGDSIEECERWTKLNQKIKTISPNLMLPSLIDLESGKTKISIFIDVSYSCQDKVQDFFDLSSSLPSAFEKEILAFSNVVSKIEKHGDKLRFSFGKDTKFSCIEDYLINNGNYPDIVCIFSDGIGRIVNPKYPQRWHWFLTEKNIHYIPPLSQWYYIEEIS